MKTGATTIPAYLEGLPPLVYAAVPDMSGVVEVVSVNVVSRAVVADPLDDEGLLVGEAPA